MIKNSEGEGDLILHNLCTKAKHLAYIYAYIKPSYLKLVFLTLKSQNIKQAKNNWLAAFVSIIENKE